MSRNGYEPAVPWYLTRAEHAGETCAKEKEPGSLQVWKQLNRRGKIGLRRLADHLSIRNFLRH
jgi:hypothetical protein